MTKARELDNDCRNFLLVSAGLIGYGYLYQLIWQIAFLTERPRVLRMLVPFFWLAGILQTVYLVWHWALLMYGLRFSVEDKLSGK